MDSSARQVKRPRSTTPAKGDPSPPKKKSKTTKKTKKTKSKTRAGSTVAELSTNVPATTTKTNKPTRESQTASAQGQMMAQMLSTFSKVEQSRFEAFQRSRLAPRDVSTWIAAVLADRWNLDDSSSSSGSSRPLRDLVAVGQAPEITLVVSVLAKIYAQRIVQTAVKLVRQQQQQQQADNTAATPKPLTVAQLRDAWQERQRQGLDPGFFLQSTDERDTLASTTHHQAYAQARLAALQAQDKYDAWVKKQQEEQADKEQQQENEDTNGDDDDKMEEDEKDGKESEEKDDVEDDKAEKNNKKSGKDDDDDDEDYDIDEDMDLT